jgi:PPOX class probable F420-dependent enzyme
MGCGSVGMRQRYPIAHRAINARVTADEARRRFASARVARLATARADGRPHVIPIGFVLDGDVLYSAVDAKPKRTTRLRRLANVVENPAVSVLADHYDDDWSALWWARADGRGRVLDPHDPEAVRAVDLLVQRYPQYGEQRPRGPVLAVAVERWSGWSSA